MEIVLESGLDFSICWQGPVGLVHKCDLSSEREPSISRALSTPRSK
jgi:hypothetical protein